MTDTPEPIFTDQISGDSYTLEDIERQFRSGFTEEKWERVRELMQGFTLNSENVESAG